jgi:hypothetical protein
MAESVLEAAKALSVSVSCNPVGGDISIKIATDSVEVARELCRTVTKLGEVTQDVCKAAVTLGSLYVGYKLLRPVIDDVLKRCFGDDIGPPRTGSLHVLIRCPTDERFMEVIADYVSGRMKERLQEEFSQVGIKVEGLKVEIENMVEVNEIKEAINKRYDKWFMKTTTHAASLVFGF